MMALRIRYTPHDRAPKEATLYAEGVVLQENLQAQLATAEGRKVEIQEIELQHSSQPKPGEDCPCCGHRVPPPPPSALPAKESPEADKAETLGRAAATSHAVFG